MSQLLNGTQEIRNSQFEDLDNDVKTKLSRDLDWHRKEQEPNRSALKVAMNETSENLANKRIICSNTPAVC